MNFQVPTTAAAPTAAGGGFSFGLPTATAGAKPPTFSLGANTTILPQKAPTTGITGIGGFSSNTPAPATLTGFAFGTTPAAPTTTVSALPTLTGFGTTTSTAAAPLTGGLVGFSQSVSATTTPGTAAAAASAPVPALNLSFGATPSTAATKPTLPVLTGFGASPASATTTASTGFALTKTTAAPALGGLGALTAPTTTTGGFASLTTATKTTDSAAISNIPHITYNQLEEHINKWTLELEEQEKVFTEQATQINAWDKVLISNNQKILELNDAVQKVKNDQQMVEQELEFISTQHKELEESIAPLQKEFLKLPQVDVERSQTYLIVENLDTQLKQMSEDLKEIIDNLNEANKGQDNTDPIIQIGKILNAHMGSLQWIESSSANITNKLEDIEKMHESFKRDSERSFRSAYYNDYKIN